MLSKLRSWWRALGPGLVTGAADDDPSGIATYSQTGALFGFGQLWVMLFSFPFMTVIQEMCGRIGMVTGDGLAGIIRKRYSKTVLGFAMILLLLANTINIGADLGAMTASLLLLIPLPFAPTLLAIACMSVLVQIVVPYPLYAKFLKVAAFSLLAYVVTVFLVKLDWVAVLQSTLIPHITISKEYALNIAALLGTTISPYLFFWQADEEVEEEIEQHKLTDAGEGTPVVRDSEIRQMRIDTTVGMFFSNLIAFFIIITVAVTLGASGVREIATAADAASALRPVAGDFAFLLFAIGIIGTGMLAIPILAGSAGYAVAEGFGWKVGLGKRFGQARGFYLVIAAITIVGVLVNFVGIDPIRMLYYSAMLNGVLAPPLMIIILMIGNDERIMGSRRNSTLSNVLALIITAVMVIVGIVALLTFIV